jgi:HEAT repeat protein
MRLITDLDLTRLAPDLRPYLASPASEERAGAARGIGRLHDRSAIELVRPLLDDAVYDVRQAAKLALESLTGVAAPRRPRPPAPAERREGPLMWTSGADEGAGASQGGWQAALRARFGMAAEPRWPPSDPANGPGERGDAGETNDPGESTPGDE